MGGYPPAYPPAAGPSAAFAPVPTPGPRPSGKANAILLLGISSLVLLCLALFLIPIGLVPAIIALAMAPGAKREIAESGGAVTGTGLVKAGVICSWISVGLVIAGVALVASLFALGTVSDSTTQTTTDTLSESGVGLAGVAVGLPVWVLARRRTRAATPFETLVTSKEY